MILIRYQLYCTQCGRQYKEDQFESIDDVIKYYPSDWVRKKVENGSEWDFCPRCLKYEEEEV